MLKELREQILDRFMASPAAGAIGRELERDRLAERAALADKVRAAEAEATRALAVWDRNIAPARDRLRRSEADAHTARFELLALERQRDADVGLISSKAERSRNELVATASALIRQIDEELRAMLVEFTKDRQTLYERAIDDRQVATYTTGPSVEARMHHVLQICFWLRDKATRLPLSDDEIRARVNERLAALPSVEMIDIRPESWRF